ncbi:MAG: peptidase S15 [Rhodospirillaceae bacterium]|nr:peptidase S15 [Rhodospirillaceae bacterium]
MTTRTAFPRTIKENTTLWIPMADGRRLAARVWLPVDADDDPVPAIVESIPYRRLDGTITADAPTHPWWAGHGYAAIRLDIAGSGDSDGLLHDEYLQSEQDDICEALAWIADQPWCNGNTGMIGISWGGFAGLQVAACRPPSLKAIITVCSTDERYNDDVHNMGGCLLNDGVSWGSGIFACISRWPDPTIVGDRWRDMWLERLQETGCPLIDWVSHQRRDAFWKHGSVCEDYSDIEAAVYAVGGWTDGYTNALIRLMEHLPGPKRALVGPWTHVYPHFGTPGEPIGFLQDSLRWWDRWLKGVDNGLDDEPVLSLFMQTGLHAHPMEFAIDGQWFHETAWPPQAQNQTLHLGDHVLAAEPQPGHSFRHSSPLECGMGGGEWCPRDGGGVGPEYQDDQRADDLMSLAFDSAPLTEDIEILGAPEIVLDLGIDRPQGMIAVRLNEVTPDGHSSRITYGLLNLSHRHSNEHPEPMVPGRPERIRLTLNHTAYRFRAGCRLRLAISTSYWPMAWPSPEPVTLSVASEGSNLTLPVVDTSNADRPMFEPAEYSADHPTQEIEPSATRRTLTRDIGSGALVLHHEEYTGRTLIEDIGLIGSKRSEETFTIVEGDPASARTDMLRVVEGERGEWKPRTETRITMTCDATSFFIKASLQAFEGGEKILERHWDETIPRDRM